MDALRKYSASPSPSLKSDSSEKEENDIEKSSEQERRLESPLLFSSDLLPPSYWI